MMDVIHGAARSTGRRRERCWTCSCSRASRPRSRCRCSRAASGGDWCWPGWSSRAQLPGAGQPTNHLDIESREALEDALEAFPGTLLVVSHDRALIEAIATRTIAIEDGRLRQREGGFGEYARDHERVIEGRPAAPAKQPPAKPAPPRRAPPPLNGRGARRCGWRPRSESWRREMGAIETRLAQPDAYTDHAALADDGRRHRRLPGGLACLSPVGTARRLSPPRPATVRIGMAPSSIRSASVGPSTSSMIRAVTPSLRSSP